MRVKIRGRKIGREDHRRREGKRRKQRGGKGLYREELPRKNSSKEFLVKGRLEIMGGGRSVGGKAYWKKERKVFMIGKGQEGTFCSV